METYNMKADPAEAHDVAAAHPHVVKRFEDYLRTARTESELWPINENVPLRKGGRDAGKKKSE